MSPPGYAMAADAVMTLHLALVLFVIAVPLLLPFGWRRGRRWARGWMLRAIHLVVLGVVVAQSWVGALCPLTVWEQRLRAASGGASWQGDFIAHWIEALLYVSAPVWAFALVYTLFLAGVVAVNWCFPPASNGQLASWRRLPR